MSKSSVISAFSGFLLALCSSVSASELRIVGTGDGWLIAQGPEGTRFDVSAERGPAPLNVIFVWIDKNGWRCRETDRQLP